MEGTGFSSLRTRDAQSAIPNLERVEAVTSWGRLIFYVSDVDDLWNHLKGRGFDPKIPQYASWGERHFHVPDPDGPSPTGFQCENRRSGEVKNGSATFEGLIQQGPSHRVYRGLGSRPAIKVEDPVPFQIRRTCSSTGDSRGSCMSSVRVLVVDDYEPFRRFVCSTLCQRPTLQIICEASDGAEAVRRAAELKPDLIILDIGLPTLNGIEAARRIRKVSPNSKIIYVSQESSADIVQEALSVGALAYVVKAHAGNDLLAAVDAILESSQFVSGGLTGH